MRHTLTAPLGLLLALPLAGAALPALGDSAEPLLKDRDQQTLGKAVAEYFEALTESSGINEAFEEVKQAVDKQDKRLKKQLDGGTFLQSTADWQRILYHANAYNDKGVKKGKQTEHASVITWKNIRYNQSLDDDLFSQRRLSQGL